MSRNPAFSEPQIGLSSEKVKQMSALIVIAFRDAHRAAEVFAELRRREWDWIADLDHAVVVEWPACDRLRVQLNVDPTSKEGDSWARLWGSLLRLTLMVPDTDGITAAARDIVNTMGDSLGTKGATGNSRVLPRHWWKNTLRISDEFIRDVGAMVQPGDSAMFMLLKAPTIVSVLRQLRNYGGTLLHTSLTVEQEETLKEALSLA